MVLAIAAGYTQLCLLQPPTGSGTANLQRAWTIMPQDWTAEIGVSQSHLRQLDAFHLAVETRSSNRCNALRQDAHSTSIPDFIAGIGAASVYLNKEPFGYLDTTRLILSAQRDT